MTISFLKVASIFIFIFSTAYLNAQSFDRKVFASAGRDANNGLTGLSKRFMTYTIGEPIIYKGSNSTRQLNNGFIQPIGITPISPPPPSGMILANGDIACLPKSFWNIYYTECKLRNRRSHSRATYRYKR